MRVISSVCALSLLLCLPGAAQADNQEAQPPEDVGEGFSLMEEGAKIILRGLLEEMEPAMTDLHGFAEDLGPFLNELSGMIGDVTHYHLPEVLPNGDIIIRRKSLMDDGAGTGDGEIDL